MGSVIPGFIAPGDGNVQVLINASLDVSTMRLRMTVGKTILQVKAPLRADNTFDFFGLPQKRGAVVPGPFSALIPEQENVFSLWPISPARDAEEIK